MTGALDFTRRLENTGIAFLQHEPLAPHTTFKIGGPARWFCEPDSEVKLREVLQICRENNIRFYLLGKGSNILFADEGFDGAVIHIGAAMADIRVEGNRICAQAGAKLADVCRTAADAGLSGLEFAYGIPGSIGGAVYMNAGAYGGEMRDVLESASFIAADGCVGLVPAEEMELGYRTSVFSRRSGCIVSAVLHLQKGTPEDIRAQMAEFSRRRAEKQPLNFPSAGSTFKRPEGAFAGALIEQCGLRGYSVGGAAVSEKHCGFVINKGGATCRDVLELTDRIAEIVKEKTGFTLEKEIRVVR